MNKVTVVIPIYKTTLNCWEQISLRQCMSILGNYPIVFVAPQSLDTVLLEHTYGIKEVIRFNDSYFKGISGYNRLMLSPEFYETFLDYTYLLIYQTDAFVFSDQLSQWCDKGYDYIGAPWIPSEKYNRPFYRKELAISQFIFKTLAIYNTRSNYFHTGNGGFSLRKTETCFRVCFNNGAQIRKFLNHSSYHYAEDIYWGIHVNRKKQQVQIPDYNESISFAFENHPELLYRYNRQRLPFGAHAWYKERNIGFWKSFIPACSQAGEILSNQ